MLLKILGTILLVAAIYVMGQDNRDTDKFYTAVNALMESKFNELYPAPKIANGKYPGREESLARRELKMAFMDGDEHFFEQKTRVLEEQLLELSVAAAKGRFQRFKAACKIKPRKGC